MKKLKTVLAAAMAAVMVVTMTGCDEEITPSGPAQGAPNANGGGATSSQAEVIEKTDFEDEDVKAAAAALVDKLDNKDLQVTKRIKWLAWYDQDETTPAAELFKAAYGTPSEGSDDKSAGRIFEFTNVSYEARFDKLATSIASDDSPDLFPFEINDFPYGILMNRYQPIDDLVDLNSDKWKGTKTLMDGFQLGGKHYAAFWEITLNSLMWYRKSNIEAIGADDPQELFKQGKWDWDSFLALARKWQSSGTSDSPRFVTDGFSAEDEFVVTTGTPMIGSDGTKLINNLHDPNVERAITGVIATLQSENLRYPRHELNEWGVNYNAWADGSNLFFCEGTWRYEQTLQKLATKNKWAEDEIRVVPFPKDPKADKYYVQVKQDAPMWVKGSTNKEGVQAWLDCCATAATDPNTTEVAKQRLIKNPKTGWTQELLDFLYPLYALDGSSPLTPVVEMKRGLGPSAFDDQDSDSPISALTSRVYIQGDSYVQLREEHEGTISKAIEDINKAIEKQ